MRQHWLKLTGAGTVALALNGCPVTDDYFIDHDAALAGGGASNGGKGADGGTASLPQAGSMPSGGVGAVAGTGGAATAGSGAASNGGTANNGGEPTLPAGGASEAGGGAPDLGSAGQAGSPSEPCVPATERCNGHDDNCNDVIDEQACNSVQNGTVGCSGFVLSSRPDHGYMLCTGMRDYSHAQEACAAQGMRLAWLESADENTQVATKVNAIAKDSEVYIGANDIANEGKWYWDGGAQFWDGNYNGKPVNGMYSNWSQGSPNNAMFNEDCALLSAGTASWGDRTCSIKFAYLCEEAEP